MNVQTGTIEVASIYKVIGNTDTTEGRGSSVLLGTFLDMGAALAWAEGRGVMGTPADVRSEAAKIVRVGDRAYVLGQRVDTTIAEAKEAALADLRKAALAKLTTAEREALGVK